MAGWSVKGESKAAVQGRVGRGEEEKKKPHRKQGGRRVMSERWEGRRERREESKSSWKDRKDLKEKKSYLLRLLSF